MRKDEDNLPLLEFGVIVSSKKVLRIYI